MTRKLTRTGIAAIVVAGTVAAMTGSALPAQAKPNLVYSTETVYIYYSNASRTTDIGDRGYGCQWISWGSTSAYYVIDTYRCVVTTD